MLADGSRLRSQSSETIGAGHMWISFADLASGHRRPRRPLRDRPVPTSVMPKPRERCERPSTIVTLATADAVGARPKAAPCSHEDTPQEPDSG
jgi:hypothetical protein